jgi:hypothetical protein
MVGYLLLVLLLSHSNKRRNIFFVFACLNNSPPQKKTKKKNDCFNMCSYWCNLKWQPEKLTFQSWTIILVNNSSCLYCTVGSGCCFM